MKKKVKKPLILMIAVVLASAFGLAGCGGKKANVIRINEVAHSLFYAPMYAAIELGYLKEAGYEVELALGNGANNVMIALNSGAADIGLMGPEASVYTNIAGKLDYPVIFGQLTKRDGSFLLGKTAEPDFEWSNLKGKRVLAGRKGGMPAMTLQYVIETVGGLSLNELNFDTDVSFALQGSVFDSDATVHYTTLFEPTASEFVALGKGYSIVACVGEVSGNVPYTAFSANKSYLDKNPELIKAFLNAMRRGYEYLQTADPDEAAAVLRKQFTTTSIESIKMLITSYNAIDAWAETPVMSEESFNKLQDIMQNAGELKASDRQEFSKLVDNSFATAVMAG